MKTQPILETNRLRLRPLTDADGHTIQNAACQRDVADTMISIPHPYPAGEAHRLIRQRMDEWAAGDAAAFLVEDSNTGQFCGFAEIRDIDHKHLQGELSFWLIPELWGKGYMSEVVAAMVRFGFQHLGLNRIYAHHMARNPASGRVLEKNGFQREGLLRQRVRKWGQFEDVLLWAILRSDKIP